MSPRARAAACSTIALLSVLSLAVTLVAEPPEGPKKDDASAAEKPAAAAKKPESPRVTLEQARQRAKLAHNIYASTLDVLHHRYFRDDRSSIPAKAMEDVFAEIHQRENIKANWIAVNTRAMSINHKPEGDFEKRAVKAIKSGERAYEAVEQGVYRRAERISLMNRGCLGCHLGFGASAKTKRFAGLVITIPIEKE